MAVKKHKVPYDLIRQCIDNEELGTLFYYYELRRRFKNRTIYNFTYKRSAEILGVSKAVAHKHIRIMLKKKWCHIHYGNLTVLGVNKLLERFEGKLVVPVPIEKTKRDQIAQYRYVIIHNNLISQRKQIQKKSAIVSKANTSGLLLSSKQIKFMAQHGGSLVLERKILNRLTLSNKKLGYHLNRSQKSGANYQKQFRDMELIVSLTHFNVLQRNLDVCIWVYLSKFYDNSSNVRLCNRNIVSQSSNTIYPLDTPLRGKWIGEALVVGNKPEQINQDTNKN